MFWLKPMMYSTVAYPLVGWLKTLYMTLKTIFFARVFLQQKSIFR
jgi:hypothetical protein